MHTFMRARARTHTHTHTHTHIYIHTHTHTNTHTHTQQNTQIPKITCISQLQAKNTEITSNILKKITITVYSTPVIKRALQTENAKSNTTYVSCHPTILIYNVLFTRKLGTNLV